MDRAHWEERVRECWYVICDVWDSGKQLGAPVVHTVVWIMLLPMLILRLGVACGAWLVRGVILGTLAVLGAALLLNIGVAVAHVLLYPLLH